jgi:hypothetical protein
MDVVLGGEHEQGQIGAGGADPADEGAALLAGQPVIEQDRVELGLLRILEHLLGRVEIGGAAHPPAGARADGGDEPPLGGLVVDQQQATIGIRPHSLPLARQSPGLDELGKGGLKSVCPECRKQPAARPSTEKARA